MLSDAKIRSLKPREKAYKVSDDRGLYLLVNPNGSRWWRFKYYFGGKERGISLGVYPDVPLKYAREQREDARKLVARGIDPSVERRTKRIALENSFKLIAEEWLALQSKKLAEITMTKARWILDSFVYPRLGSRPIALKLSPLVFVRPSELRAAEWTEIDLQAAEWRIPAERMKMRERHVVPLSTQAIALLRDLRSIARKSRYVFPSLQSRDRPMSVNTVNGALRRLGYARDEMTAHGFRAMACTCLNELGWHPDLIELQLAHAERNKVRAAYNRAERLADRKKMMQAWEDYLDALRAGRRGLSPSETTRPTPRVETSAHVRKPEKRRASAALQLELAFSTDE